MKINDQTKKKKNAGEKICLAIIGGLFFIADIIVVLFYLAFAMASALSVSNFLTPFVYISFVLSLLVLLVSTIKEIKNFAQRNKSFSLISSAFFALLYTLIRIKYFPDVFQFEDLGTAVIIILSYLVVLLEKRIHPSPKVETMQMESVSREDYGEDYDSVVLEQWKICVEMANSNTEKRTNSNNIFITINAALLAVVSFSMEYKSMLLSVVGIAVCVVWIYSIESYKKLSSVKYHIVNEMEQRLPLKPFAYEWSKLKTEKKYLGLTHIEKILPGLFILLYGISIILPILKWLSTVIGTCKGGCA